MTPQATVTLITGVIACIIGVCTFVVGITSRAKETGILTNKVDTALKGIEEIKNTLNEQRSWRETMARDVEAHEQKIKTLFERMEDVEEELKKFRYNKA